MQDLVSTSQSNKIRGLQRPLKIKERCKMNIIKRHISPTLANKPTRKLYAVLYSNGIGAWTTYDKAIEEAERFGRYTIIEDTFIDVSKL